jgi:hypothetical protein
MYNTALVDTICRRYMEEDNRQRQDQLLDFLEAVVLEDQPGIREQLTELIDVVSNRELQLAN